MRQVSWLSDLLTPSHPDGSGQWPKKIVSNKIRITVAGTAPDYHTGFPFNPLMK
jgi:hypothetical protein